MKQLFEYNWQKRGEWFNWCDQIQHQELVKKRVGGLNSILKTLFHIVDVEQRWVARLLSEEVIRYNFQQFQSLDKVKEFSRTEIIKTKDFLNHVTEAFLQKEIQFISQDGKQVSRQGEKILNHMIAHEIHHTGQLSIWARELGITPVSANLVERNLF